MELKDLSGILKISIVIVVLNASIVHRSSCEQHSTKSVKKMFLRSFYSLTVLASTEEEIYENLKDSHGLLQIPSILDWYIEDYLDSCDLVTRLKSSNWESESKNIIAGQPLLSYRMLHRYIVFLPQILKDLKENSGVSENLQSLVDNIEYTVGWPERSDVENAMTAILRIQHVYDLNLMEFVHGNISGSEIKPLVQAIHCSELGNFAIDEGYYALAVEWHELAKLLVTDGTDQTVDLDTVNGWLNSALAVHDLQWTKKENNDPAFFTQKLQTITDKNLRQKRRNFLTNYWRGERAMNFNAYNFWGLCSGDDMRTEKEKAALFCWYDSKSNPAWVINPLKYEQLGITPPIFQIYEVLPNNLIRKLIDESQPDLVKSQVYSNDPSNRKESTQRTSLNTWLEDGQIPELITIPRRIELITGLSVLPSTSSEKIQIATYTFGGHYEVHQDVFKDPAEYWNAIKGDRIATFMIYLSGVEKGGFTAFPQAGIAAQPVKGSAVFWYNLKRNGQPDDNTWHGACPCVQGSKWVANKWIRVNDQFLTRPCTLNPED